MLSTRGKCVVLIVFVSLLLIRPFLVPLEAQDTLVPVDPLIFASLDGGYGGHSSSSVFVDGTPASDWDSTTGMWSLHSGVITEGLLTVSNSTNTYVVEVTRVLPGELYEDGALHVQASPEEWGIVGVVRYPDLGVYSVFGYGHDTWGLVAHEYWNFSTRIWESEKSWDDAKMLIRVVPDTGETPTMVPPTSVPTETVLPTDTPVPTAVPTETARPTNTAIPIPPTETPPPPNTPVPTATMVPTATPLPDPGPCSCDVPFQPFVFALDGTLGICSDTQPYINGVPAEPEYRATTCWNWVYELVPDSAEVVTEFGSEGFQVYRYSTGGLWQSNRDTLGIESDAPFQVVELDRVHEEKYVYSLTGEGYTTLIEWGREKYFFYEGGWTEDPNWGIHTVIGVEYSVSPTPTPVAQPTPIDFVPTDWLYIPLVLR